jgi:hypothetical protein
MCSQKKRALASLVVRCCSAVSVSHWFAVRLIWRIDVLIAALIEGPSLLIMTSCALACRVKRFGGVCCLCLQGIRETVVTSLKLEAGAPRNKCLYATVHGVISQKTAVFIDPSTIFYLRLVSLKVYQNYFAFLASSSAC